MKERKKRKSGEPKDWKNKDPRVLPLSLSPSPPHSGSLFIVATPIGNLEDITLRALRTLKEVDLILCEDKRTTIKLLNKYNIRTKLYSYHKFNERSTTDEILKELKNGKDIALVSDAGTPLISDPGSELIKDAREENIKIVPIPGASAVISAISISDKVKNEFLFIGFLSNEKNKRIELIKSLEERTKAAILYVAPHDIKKYLSEIAEIYPNIEIFIAREITKIHEEYVSGKIKDVIDKLDKKEMKGEIVLGLLFSPKEEDKLSEEEVIRLTKELTNKGFSLKEASKIISKENNLSKNKIYNLVIKETTNE